MTTESLMVDEAWLDNPRIPRAYGDAPLMIAHHNVSHCGLDEFLHYLYLPVIIGNDRHVPINLRSVEALLHEALAWCRKNSRPGWHCDGFGTDDVNFVWWKGPGTRFACQKFENISSDHVESLKQFDQQMTNADSHMQNYMQGCLYFLNRFVVHATPIIEPPGCIREYVKISGSNDRYNLKDNSHNYNLQYDWQMYDRQLLRNDTHRAQLDFLKFET